MKKIKTLVIGVLLAIGGFICGRILTAIGFCIGQNLVEKYYERKERQNVKISSK